MSSIDLLIGNWNLLTNIEQDIASAIDHEPQLKYLWPGSPGGKKIEKIIMIRNANIKSYYFIENT